MNLDILKAKVKEVLEKEFPAAAESLQVKGKPARIDLAPGQSASLELMVTLSPKAPAMGHVEALVAVCATGLSGWTNILTGSNAFACSRLQSSGAWELPIVAITVETIQSTAFMT